MFKCLLFSLLSGTVFSHRHSIGLVLNCHILVATVLYETYNIPIVKKYNRPTVFFRNRNSIDSRKVHRHSIRSPRLSAVLPSPPRVAFSNLKTLKDHLVRSRLKIRNSNDEENGIYKCGNMICDVCNVLYLSNEFQSTGTGKMYHMNFKFDCNSINMIYLLTCKRCRKQYVECTVTKFCLRFKQYKSNIKLYGEGKGGFK